MLYGSPQHQLRTSARGSSACFVCVVYSKLIPGGGIPASTLCKTDMSIPVAICGYVTDVLPLRKEQNVEQLIGVGKITPHGHTLEVLSAFCMLLRRSWRG